MMESTGVQGGQPILDREFPSPPTAPSPTQETCRICMTSMRIGQALMDCHQCRKAFHYSCYHRHLQTSPRGGCPACRYGAIPENPPSSAPPGTTNQDSPPSQPFLPLQQEASINQGMVNQGAAAPFMPPMVYQDPQIDQRALAYSFTKCALYCFLFFG